MLLAALPVKFPDPDLVPVEKVSHLSHAEKRCPEHRFPTRLEPVEVVEPRGVAQLVNEDPLVIPNERVNRSISEGEQ